MTITEKLHLMEEIDRTNKARLIAAGLIKKGGERT